MSLLKLPDDIINLVMKYLQDKEKCKLVRSCKLLWKIGCDRGFLNTISLRPDISTDLYLRNLNRHSRTLRTIIFHHQQDPHLWLFKYPEHIVCRHCTLSEKFSAPTKNRVTKSVTAINSCYCSGDEWIDKKNFSDDVSVIVERSF